MQESTRYRNAINCIVLNAALKVVKHLLGAKFLSHLIVFHIGGDVSQVKLKCQRLRLR